MFMHAVVEGIFGIMPCLGDNHIVVRPSFPAHWDFARISIPDISLAYAKSDNLITLSVNTPVKRSVTVELPVITGVRSVRLNGKEVSYTAVAAVNCCRVKLEIPEGESFELSVEIEEASPGIDGDRRIVAGREACFTAYNCRVGRIYDSQGRTVKARVAEQKEGEGNKISRIFITPVDMGKYTVFAELHCSNTSFLYPLDLEVRRPWSIIQKYFPSDGSRRAGVESPRFNRKEKTIHMEIENNLDDAINEVAEIIAGGVTLKKEVFILPRSVASVIVDLGDAAYRIPPGKVQIEMKLAGHAEAANAVNWEPVNPYILNFSDRLRQLNLEECYTENLQHLFSPEFKWRIDYTGCGVGIDWREPIPEKDKLGYVLLSPPISQFEYGILPEQWNCTAYWEVPRLEHIIETPAGIKFKTAGVMEGRNILALASTQPYEQLPSSVTLRFPIPIKVEKIYLLTANLTKTLKCYYPGGEVVIRHEDGSERLHQLIPPYTMSCMVQDFCPTAMAIPFGQIRNGGAPLNFGANPKDAYISLSDIVVDASCPVKEIELKCVASETILGVLGITVLAAE
ncbi:MAG: hypothetical protein ACOX27_00275 [Caldicoprobacterales bacterium]